jgi:hypothetical protein
MQPFYSQIESLKKRFSTKLSKGKKKKGSGFRNLFLICETNEASRKEYERKTTRKEGKFICY